MSDTGAPVHSSILAALADANEGAAASYGADRWSAEARATLCETFETELDVWLVGSGTAANALGLAILCPATGSILCHREAHIERDERGAPGFFTGGAKLDLLDGDHGRIDPAALSRRLAAYTPSMVHETPARVLSLSNLTESGSAYFPKDLVGCASLARAAGLSVHLDGARFGNAVAGTGATPAEQSWRAGVDVMSFGATKNGAMGCESILLFGEARSRFPELQARAKQAGHMPPKMRYVAAQMSAYLRGGLWLELARDANAAAAELQTVLTDAGGGSLAHPRDGNEVFVNLSESTRARLREGGVAFYDWFDGSCRFVCSWSTTDQDINRVRSLL